MRRAAGYKSSEVSLPQPGQGKDTNSPAKQVPAGGGTAGPAAAVAHRDFPDMSARKGGLGPLKPIDGVSASGLSESDKAAARAEFKKVDYNNNGSIDKSELFVLLKRLVPNMTEDFLVRMTEDQMRAKDKNFKGMVEMDEFLDLYARCKTFR